MLPGIRTQDKRYLVRHLPGQKMLLKFVKFLFFSIFRGMKRRSSFGKALIIACFSTVYAIKVVAIQFFLKMCHKFDVKRV